MVRVLTVLLAFFASAPVGVAYIIGAIALPAGESAAGLGGVLAVIGGLGMILASLAGIEPGAALGVLGAWSSLLWPAALLLGAGGLVPRPYVLTVTHGALWVERPWHRARRIDLADVEGLHRGPSGFAVLLRDGELLHLAPPPDDLALDAFHEQMQSARRRALGHRVDLEQAEAERKQLQAILAARQGE